MSASEFTVTTTCGEYDLTASVRLVGQDLMVVIWGGTPHIGAVAMAQSRPSLKNPSVVSATASIFCYVGHKESELAKYVSEKLSAVFDTHVVVAVGAHWDNIEEDSIHIVLENSREIVDLISERVNKLPRSKLVGY